MKFFSLIFRWTSRFVRRREVWLPSFSVIIFSLLSNWQGWDLRAQEFFWDGEEWTGRDSSIFRSLYAYGVIPALVIGIGSLFLIVFSYSIPFLRDWRRLLWYFLLVFIIGNGLITNALLKEQWGRPRPVQVEPFGGIYDFEPVLAMDIESSGKSFPSGHASMGFYLFSLGLVCAGWWRKTIIGLALIAGGWIGLARMSYGGHFLTDVVWAGLILWLTSLAVFDWLRLGEGLRWSISPPRNRKEAMRRKVAGLVTVPLFSIIVFAIALLTPRDKRHLLEIEASPSDLSELHIQHGGILRFEAAEDGLTGTVHAQGFGFPKSEVRLRSEAAGDVKVLTHQVRGFFTELKVTTTFALPEGGIFRIRIEDPESIEAVIVQGRRLDVPVLESSEFEFRVREGAVFRMSDSSNP